MNLEFWVNQIFKDIQENKVYRVLWISDNIEFFFAIDIHSTTLQIRMFEVEEITESIQTGRISYINEDPYDRVVLSDTTKTYKKVNIEQAVKVVEFITCSENEPDVFYEHGRREIIYKAKEEFKISETSIYKYLRIYWQGGMSPDALIPKYSNCGNKGNRKNSSENTKLGRPNDISYIYKDRAGVNLTDRDREIFRHMIKTEYKKYDVSLEKVYENTKEKYYSDYIVENGERRRVGRPTHTFPTIGQFRNFYYNEMRKKNPIEALRNKIGDKKFEKDKRGLKSNSRQEVFGPGFMYQIDSTRYNVNLRNRLDRKHNVGHPTVYLIPDVATSLIAGVHVGLDAPSKSSVAYAIYTIVIDKNELCEKYGINKYGRKWPNTPLARYLLADNAELAGIMPENAIKNLLMFVDNTPSGRPDLKAIVENIFYQIELELRPFVPGMGVGNYKLRGESDVRLDACLDIVEFTKLVLIAVLHHNNDIIEKYPVTEDMLKEKVPAIPADMWELGIKKCSGKPKKPNLNKVKLNLMYSGKANITRNGIEFIGILYECNLAEGEEWFFKARNYGEWDVDIRYDVNDLTNIYIVNEDASRFEICYLKRENLFYAGLSYDEVVVCKKDYNIQVKLQADRLNQNDVCKVNEMKEVVRNAKRDNKTKNGESIESKKEAMKNVNANKEIESKSYQKEHILKPEGVDNTNYQQSRENEIIDDEDEILNAIIRFNKGES